VAALYAATRRKPGIVVISGTGCVAAGVNEAGEYARAGGWGYLIDDEGSAFDIGRKALTRAFRMLDGRARPTNLISILKRKFQVKMLEDALSLIYANGVSVEEVARLASLVSRAASRDKACKEILNNAGITLAELACAVARRLCMTDDSFKVATVGGSFKSGRHLLKPFTARIKSECPRARVIRLKVEPARGAFLLAASELLNRSDHRTRSRT
jgi:N-acetylglucosamine kinase-like BadF-type ATPase